MPHIHSKAGHHDHTVSAFIVREDGGSPRLLLHQHKTLGVLLQIGGHVELDENPWQAIIREITEESGYEMDQLTLLQPPFKKLERVSGGVAHPYPVSYLTHPLPNLDHFHTDIGFGFVTDQSPRRAVGSSESDTLGYYDRTDLASKLPEGSLPPNIREISLFIFDVCLPTWDRLPAIRF